jgi:transcriptional regulator with XRE-family HTH domain
LNSVGPLIGDLRRSRLLSMDRLARMAGISASTISRWEAGLHAPCVMELDAVLAALDASARETRQAYASIQAPRAVEVLRLAAAPDTLFSGSAPSAGDLLRAIRQRGGQSLERAADAVRVNPSTLSRWERCVSWPAPGKVGEICRQFRVHDDEICALSNGRYSLLCRDEPLRPVSHLDAALQSLAHRVVHGHAHPLDCAFLTLGARLWRHDLTNCRHALGLLRDAYTWHAYWLCEQERHCEALPPARLALDLQREIGHGRYATQAVVAAALAISELAGRDREPTALALTLKRENAQDPWEPGPRGAAALIAHYLPRAGADNAVLLTHLASMTARAGDITLASVLIERARDEAAERKSATAIRGARLAQADILENSGDAARALLVLPGDEPRNIYHQARECLLRARVHHGVGDRRSACLSMSDVYAIIESCDFIHFRPRANAVATRFQLPWATAPGFGLRRGAVVP